MKTEPLRHWAHSRKQPIVFKCWCGFWVKPVITGLRCTNVEHFLRHTADFVCVWQRLPKLDPRRRYTKYKRLFRNQYIGNCCKYCWMIVCRKDRHSSWRGRDIQIRWLLVRKEKQKLCDNLTYRKEVFIEILVRVGWCTTVLTILDIVSREYSGICRELRFCICFWLK